MSSHTHKQEIYWQLKLPKKKERRFKKKLEEGNNDKVFIFMFKAKIKSHKYTQNKKVFLFMIIEIFSLSLICVGRSTHTICLCVASILCFGKLKIVEQIALQSDE